MEVRERVRKVLKDLIAIPSVSGKEERILRYIEEYLNRLGLKAIRQEVDGKRYNLLYEGSSDLLVSVHVDTVPPAGFRKAYRPEEREGRIYGRGASDVKGAIASLLVALEYFRESYPRRELPFSVAFVVDEEQNSALGSEKLAKTLKGKKRVLVLEPTYGKLCTAQYGALEFTLKVRCPSAHGSEFEKVKNPVKLFMEFVRELERRLKRQVNIMMVKGGSKIYRVPDSCEALLEVKVNPGESPDTLKEEIRKLCGELSGECSLEFVVEDEEAFHTFKKEGLYEMLAGILREVEGRAEEGVMPSWTDASNYHKEGYECVVFGYGSLIDSHTDRESISLEELEKFTLFFIKLLERLSEKTS
ncbi:MAG: M20 family metallopeptidase [Aquificae bacterium]|nr:M20 family metallopeptidase [Aquificota bacterium]